MLLLPHEVTALVADSDEIPQGNRLAGGLRGDRAAEEAILIKDANFAEITRVEANRRLFTDVSSQRERQIPKALKVDSRSSLRQRSGQRS
jgi:hypothetical protein